MLRTDQSSTSLVNKAKALPQGRGETLDRSSQPNPSLLLSRRKFGPVWAGSLASSVIAISGAYHGFKGLKRWVRNQNPFPVTAQDIVFKPEPPAWLIDARNKVLELIPESDFEQGLLNFDLDEVVRRLRMRQPWIESVSSIKLIHPQQIELNVTFREPIMALSRINSGQLLLDRHGVVLSANEVSKEKREKLIEFNYPDLMVQQVLQRGGKNPFDLEPGQIWEDKRVTESLKLADFLTSQMVLKKQSKQIFWLIDAANVQDRLILRTIEGLWISWGRPPGQERPGEPSAEKKWDLLMDWLKNHNQINSVEMKQTILVFEKDKAILTRGS